MGTDTEFGRPAVQIEGQAQCPIHRSGTLNVQRSTLNFQRGDRKGAWGAGYGDRHGIWATELLTGWTWPSTGRTVQAGGVPRYGDRHGAWGPAVQIEGQAQCPIHRSGTLNVQRSTLNFQLGDRKGAWWAGYGDRHGIWATELLTRWTWPNTGRTVQAGGVPRYGDRHGAWGPTVQIEGQARCPIHQSGTFNAQRSTLNFQRGDGKGAWWPGYGDRHGIWATGGANRGTGTMSDTPIRNVERPTLNPQLSTGRPERRVVGGIWGQTQCLGTDSANRGTGTMSDTAIRNVERPTLNSQLATGRPKGRMVGGMWGQTRFCGDTYRWAFHDATPSLLAVSVFSQGA